jgi:hypothetical protein
MRLSCELAKSFGIYVFFASAVVKFSSAQCGGKGFVIFGKILLVPFFSPRLRVSA